MLSLRMMWTLQVIWWMEPFLFIYLLRHLSLITSKASFITLLIMAYHPLQSSGKCRNLFVIIMFLKLDLMSFLFKFNLKCSQSFSLGPIHIIIRMILAYLILTSHLDHSLSGEQLVDSRSHGWRVLFCVPQRMGVFVVFLGQWLFLLFP